MSIKLPIKALREAAWKMPQASEQYDIGDFYGRTQSPRLENITGGARRMLRSYGPILREHMDLKQVPARHRLKVELAAACAVHRIMRTTTVGEATLAKTSLTTWTTQKILSITRAYPTLFALRYFGFLPMSGPTARMFFKVRTYGDAMLNNGTPTVAAGSAVDDFANFNKNYTLAPEGSIARRMSFYQKFLDISAKDHRVLGEWTEQLVEDYMNVHNGDAVAEHMDEAWFLLGWVIDRTVFDTASANVPAGNKVTHDANPAGYAGWTPDQQAAYDQRLFSHGVVPVIEKIRARNKFGPDSAPDFMVVGTDVARLLRRQKGFVASDRSAREIDIETGPIRDFGRFDSENLDVIVDPQYTANKAFFGRTPRRAGDPAIYLGMYVPAQLTKDLYDPNTGQTIQGVRSRFAVAAPDASEPESFELVRNYGELTVNNASAV